MKREIVVALVIAGSSIVASWFTASASITERLNNTATVINSSISEDRQRLSAVETDLKNIKDLQLETRNDIKIILKAVK